VLTTRVISSLLSSTRDSEAAKEFQPPGSCVDQQLRMVCPSVCWHSRRTVISSFRCIFDLPSQSVSEEALQRHMGPAREQGTGGSSSPRPPPLTTPIHHRRLPGAIVVGLMPFCRFASNLFNSHIGCNDVKRYLQPTQSLTVLRCPRVVTTAGRPKAR